MADNENIIEGSQLAEERERDLAEAEATAGASLKAGDSECVLLWIADSWMAIVDGGIVCSGRPSVGDAASHAMRATNTAEADWDYVYDCGDGCYYRMIYKPAESESLTGDQLITLQELSSQPSYGEREEILSDAELFAATAHLTGERIMSGMDRLIDNLRRGEAVAS